LGAESSAPLGTLMERLIKPFLLLFAAVITVYALEKVILFKFNYLKNNPTEYYTTVTLNERQRQLECLAQNIYYEAAREPFEGKVAVAQVTLNRVESGLFPADICKTIYQKNVFFDKVICQFSWYCDKAATRKPVHEPAFEECYAVAKKVLLEGFRLDGLTEALYYHANYVNPGWKKQKIATIGNHIFYK
jgi:spore germination cell wall hydrolase CwlJ-like protein